MKYTLLLLALPVMADTINPFNIRPVTLGGTYDSPASCAGFGSPSCNLFDLLPALGATPWSMSNVGLWSATGDFTIDYLAEVTAGADSQQFGIWSGLAAQPLFGPSAVGGESVTVTQSQMSLWGIDPNGFGFYLSTNVNPLHMWMYTLDAFNYPLIDGPAQALSIQTPNYWVLAFEDTIRGTGDNDYNDAIVRVDGVNPAAQVPEPAGWVMVGTGVVLLGIARKLKGNRS